MLYTQTLNSNKIYQALYKKGKCIFAGHIVIYVFKNRLPFNRLGITAGKKVGNAVCRNRAKRLIREAYRQCEIDMPLGLDLVIVAKESIVHEKLDAVLKPLRRKIAEISKV
jgi:ribonuclease P protein component